MEDPVRNLLGQVGTGRRKAKQASDYHSVERLKASDVSDME